MKTRVLVIDDEECVANSLAMVLSAKGYDVIAEYSGEAGLLRAKCVEMRDFVIKIRSHTAMQFSAPVVSGRRGAATATDQPQIADPAVADAVSPAGRKRRSGPSGSRRRQRQPLKQLESLPLSTAN